MQTPLGNRYRRCTQATFRDLCAPYSPAPATAPPHSLLSMIMPAPIPMPIVTHTKSDTRLPCPQLSAKVAALASLLRTQEH